MSPNPAVILHVPHDSTDIPGEYRNDILLSDPALAREIIAMTDMHTDALYTLKGAAKVTFPVSRLLLDPERFPDDAQEPMAERGMGMVYEVTSQLEPLREPPSPELKRELKEKFYDPHHLRLERATTKALQTFGKVLIIDCHSFPSKALPYEKRRPDDPRPQICIGTDEFHTPDPLYRVMRNAFETKGYSVDKDVPFSGALTPVKYYRQDERVCAIMIEVRRDLYMDQTTGERSAGFEKVKSDLTEVMEEVAEKFTDS